MSSDRLLVWALLALVAAQALRRAFGRPSFAARLVRRRPGGSSFTVWALRLWVSYGLPALAVLLLLGRGGALAVMPPEFEGVAAPLRRYGIVEAEPVLTGLLIGSALGALFVWWRLRRGRNAPSIGRPPRLPARAGELPAGALLALSAGMAEELWFRLALPLLLVLATGSAVLAFLLPAAAFAGAHRYQGAAGMAATGATALLLSALYLASGSLPLAMACHAIIDVNGLVVRPALAMRWRPPSP